MAQQDGDNGPGIGPAQVTDTTSQAAASGYKVAIRRNGQAVEITLTAADDYASMELYDSLVQSTKKGRLCLEINLGHP
jgi:hypothetical protein